MDVRFKFQSIRTRSRSAEVVQHSRMVAVYATNLVVHPSIIENLIFICLPEICS